VVNALRYRRIDLNLDYGRAAAGLVMSGAILVFVPAGIAVTMVLGSLALLFAVFGVRTALHDTTCYEVTDAGIAETGWRRVALAWSDLDGLGLRYYAPRRNAAKGWMTLALEARGTHLSIDSSLPGFERIAALAAAAARANGVVLGPVTVSNLTALGFDAGAPPGRR
jgi:hypothetical protein